MEYSLSLQQIVNVDMAWKATSVTAGLDGDLRTVKNYMQYDVELINLRPKLEDLTHSHPPLHMLTPLVCNFRR